MRREDTVQRAWLRFCDKLAREGLRAARAEARSTTRTALPRRSRRARTPCAPSPHSMSISATARALGPNRSRT